jgi:hypothetical protein
MGDPAYFTDRNGGKMDLTPAQQRLLKEAEVRPDKRVLFYGMPEKTQTKLLESGLVKKVYAVERHGEEYKKVKTELYQLADDVKIAISYEKWDKVAEVAQQIENRARKLEYQITVLA